MSVGLKQAVGLLAVHAVETGGKKASCRNWRQSIYFLHRHRTHAV